MCVLLEFTVAAGGQKNHHLHIHTSCPVFQSTATYHLGINNAVCTMYVNMVRKYSQFRLGNSVNERPGKKKKQIEASKLS